MKKTKQILIGYLTVVALLVTTSCEKELYEDAINQNSNKQLAIKKISFTEFRKNRKAFTAFKNATTESALNNSLSRGVYSEEFDAVIDTSNIVLIEKNNTKSITIKIIDEDPIKDENIVLLTTNQNNYTAYKTEYILSQQEILTLNQGQNITNKTPSAVTNLETQNRSISNSCFDFNVYTVLMCRDSNGNAIYTQGNLGDNCVGMSFEVDYFILSINANCLSSNGGFSWNPVNGTGNNNNNNNNNRANDNNGGVSSGNDYGGGGFSGTGGLPNNNNPLNTDSEFLTTPLLSSSTSIGRLLNFLTENQANFFFHGLDGEAQISILNYINENTDENGVVNSQAREFVKELMDELANISIDYYPGKEDLFPFEWWNDDALIEQYLQGPYESWRNISSEEKRLTKSFPTIAYKLYKNKDIAFQKTFQYFGNVPQVLNGKPDAFRHAFFQAINTVSVRKYFTELFANAHESEVPTIWSLEKEMDIYNNEIGMNLIEFTHPNWSNTNQIATEILNMLNNGELIYLKPINYSSPYFWDNPSTSTPNDGNHGIINNTQLTPTNQ